MKIFKTAAAALLLVLCGTALLSCAPVAEAPDAAPQSSSAAKSVKIVSASTLEPEPTPSEEPSAAPTPTVHAPTAEDIYNQLKEIDITDYIIPNTYDRDDDAHPYEIILSEPELTYRLPELYEEWFNDAANSLISLEIRNVKTKFTPPSWQMLSTLAYNYGNDIKTLREALTNACIYEIGIFRERGGYSIELSAYPRSPMELFYMTEPTERVTPFTNMLQYAYLATIYDNNMNERDGIEPRDLESFLFPIANPEEYYVGDTWGDSRDNGSRRHTGTDINAPEGTELFAVRDGEILDAGTAGGAGNYVVLLGDDGIQYHYYHMVEPTSLTPGDKVKRGDVVGYVGDTGNSTTNHLHFTIITEDGYYLNPYLYLEEAQERAVSGEDAAYGADSENAADSPAQDT